MPDRLSTMQETKLAGVTELLLACGSRYAYHFERREFPMAKAFSCKDAGVDCEFHAQADTKEELMEKIGTHAKADHGMETVPPELMEKIQAGIHEV